MQKKRREKKRKEIVSSKSPNPPKILKRQHNHQKNLSPGPEKA